MLGSLEAKRLPGATTMNFGVGSSSSLFFWEDRMLDVIVPLWKVSTIKSSLGGVCLERKVMIYSWIPISNRRPRSGGHKLLMITTSDCAGTPLEVALLI